jgi:hypothetical protein
MKGRKPSFERPVQKNFTIEAWMVEIIDDLKKFGIRPSDIVQAGLIALFKAENKLPLPIIRAFLDTVSPKVEEMNEMLEYYKKIEQTLSTLNSSSNPETITITPYVRKWYDDFHAVKFLQSGNILLLEKSAYNKQPDLFEILDDDTTINWNKLEKFYAIEAVIKVCAPENSGKGDVPA